MRIDVTTSGLQPTENTGSQKTGQRETAAAGTRDMTRDTTQAGAAGDSAQFSFDQTRIQSLSAQALSEPGLPPGHGLVAGSGYQHGRVHCRSHKSCGGALIRLQRRATQFAVMYGPADHERDRSRPFARD